LKREGNEHHNSQRIDGNFAFKELLQCKLS